MLVDRSHNQRTPLLSRLDWPGSRAKLGAKVILPVWDTESMFEGLFQPMHLIIILAVGVLLFGPKKIPEIGKGLGDGIRGFKDAIKNATEDIEKK
jgi:sec-independent protein translocase protein TatA